MKQNLQLENGTFVTIKMRTGEEVLAQLSKPVDNDFECIYITFPLIMMSTPQGLGMVPYLITVEGNKELEIPKSDIILILETSEFAKEQYQEALEGMAGNATV